MTWRALLTGPAIALASIVVAIVLTDLEGLPLRDPDGVAATYFVLVGLGVAGMVYIDCVLKAGARIGRPWPPRAAVGAVRRERWTRRRCLGAAAALAGFYATYLAYRNVKSLVPLLMPGTNYDEELADLDRAIFLGTDPANLLHDVLGTGPVTHVLSTFYVAFIVFLPLGIGVALVFSRDLRAGLFYTAAQSLNWVIGAASYYVLPALGPIYAYPDDFADLDRSEVSRLQEVLLDQRVDFLRDPGSATPQSIGAFASLHVSMSATALIAAYLLGAGRRLRTALWVWFVVTVLGTIHLGWHYVLDDVAGVALAAAALALARLFTGIDLRATRAGAA